MRTPAGVSGLQREPSLGRSGDSRRTHGATRRTRGGVGLCSSKRSPGHRESGTAATGWRAPLARFCRRPWLLRKHRPGPLSLHPPSSRRYARRAEQCESGGALYSRRESAGSPQDDRERPTVFTGPRGYPGRSEEACHQRPTDTDGAGLQGDQEGLRSVAGSPT